MDSRWCKNYPLERGIGREYRNYYWFSVSSFSNMHRGNGGMGMGRGQGHGMRWSY